MTVALGKQGCGGRKNDDGAKTLRSTCKLTASLWQRRCHQWMHVGKGGAMGVGKRVREQAGGENKVVEKNKTGKVT